MRMYPSTPTNTRPSITALPMRALVLFVLTLPLLFGAVRAEELPAGDAAVLTKSVRGNLAGVMQGKLPGSVAELKAMQERVQEITEHVAMCTVGLRVGPAHGSGVIVTEDGYVLTAAHVASNPGREAILTLVDGRTARARTLGMNFNADAGLLKIQTDGPWPFVPMGKSNVLRRGQWCLATGHPGGFEEGRAPVLRLGRILMAQDTLLGSDCTLSAGDSGGPLMSLDGEVIGIHSRIGGSVLANMHVPIDVFHKNWDRLVAGEAWGFLPGQGPYIGVHRDPSSERAKISRVMADSPAYRAGIRSGDVITRYDGVETNSFAALIRAVRGSFPGTSVAVELLREEEVVELELIVGRKDD